MNISGLQTEPSSWTIINLDRQSRALVAKGKELYLIDHGGQFQYQVDDVYLYSFFALFPLFLTEIMVKHIGSI